MHGQVWDSETLECLRTLEGHEDNVRVLAVGERYVFSGSWDKSIRCAVGPSGEHHCRGICSGHIVSLSFAALLSGCLDLGRVVDQCRHAIAVCDPL